MRKMSEQTSFLDALKEKYCDEDAENAGCEQFVQITVFGNNRQRPRGDSAGDDGGPGAGSHGGGKIAPELGYLKSVVLYNTGISHAAIPPAGLSSLCPNVSDLDLSGNLLKSWSEVMMILKHLPRLKFVNLSSNPLENLEIATCSNEDIPCSIEDLVLNDTKVSWSEVAALSRLMPKLKQLHLCKNDYNEIAFTAEEASDILCHLGVLALNNNNIKRWDEVAKLKSLPQLHTLILLENPLQDVFYKQPRSATPGDDTSVKTDDENSRLEESSPYGNKQADSEATPSNDTGEPTVGGRGVSTELHPENRNAVRMPASDSQPCQSEEGQPLLQRNQQEAAVRDVIEDSPGCVSTERDKDGSEESDGSAEIVPSTSGSSLVECDTTGDSQSTDRQASVTDKQPSVSHKHQEVPQDDEQANQGFHALESLCVSETALSDWQHLQELRHFPRLHSVKIKNIPLLESWDEADRRKLAVACLPSIKRLNGSEISETEREKSERHFVRLFMGRAQPPARHEELVQKYGKLKPLYQVDIGRGFQEFADLKFIYGGRCIQQEAIRLTQTIRELKKYCGKLVDRSPMMLKLYHNTRDPDTDELVMDELFLDSLPLSRFDMKEGDEIHIDIDVVPKGGNQWWQPGIKLAP